MPYIQNKFKFRRSGASIISKKERIMVTKKVYPLPSEIEEVEECIHGYPLGEYCPQCERDEEGDNRYHQLKDDGLLDEQNN